MSRPQDLIQGTLDLLVLKMLALNSMNGWDISQRLKLISNDALQVSHGSLYPALHKLEQEGWITAEWRPSENNRRAKFYKVTPAGRAQFRSQAPTWHRYAEAIAAGFGKPDEHEELAEILGEILDEEEQTESERLWA